MTKGRPILFSAPMVRALLAGRKSQTRRTVKPQPGTVAPLPLVPCPLGTDNWYAGNSRGEALVFNSEPVRCPYGVPGDRLWVREAAIYWTYGDGRVGGLTPVVYEGDEDWDGVNRDATLGPPKGLAVDSNHGWWKKRPSIHMPRKFSRITLLIKSVRVERLHEISEADAIAEGVDPAFRCPNCGYTAEDCGLQMDHRICGEPHPSIQSYASLWNSINGPGSWAANPWVWVVGFERIKEGTVTA